MAEIHARRGTNGLRFISTFSGCGGLCLGLEMAGYEPLMASEFVGIARETYEANHPGVFVDGRDVREMTVDDVLARTGLAVGELDVFAGSPPCKSFTSSASVATAAYGESRESRWGKVNNYSDGKSQQSDDLFFEYTRLLRGLQPRAFIAENVPGLLLGTARGYFNDIMKEMIDCGYRVQAATLDSQWLGVPQVRRRLIFIGFRNDLGIDPVFPEPLSYRYSIRDAISDLVDGTVVAQVGVDRRRRDQNNRIMFEYLDPNLPSPTITATVNLSIKNPSFFERAVLVAPPGCLEDFTQRPEWIRSDEPQKRSVYFASCKPRPEGSIEPRCLTTAEIKRVGSFPDDFVLLGDLKQQWERIGRAVPPLMSFHIAATVARALGATPCAA